MNLPKKIEHQLRDFQTRLSDVIKQVQKECDEQDKRISDLEVTLGGIQETLPEKDEFVHALQNRFVDLGECVKRDLEKIDDRITSLEEADKKLMKQISELDSTIRGLCDQHI